MTTFAAPAATPAVQKPDSSKHVNYTLGMVLGVDDFTQEFAYLSGRTEWLARDLLGYGTVCGLKVTADSDTRGPRVSVSAGVAVSPRGQLICVKPAQCAYLNDWLASNKGSLLNFGSSPPMPNLRLYVVLCYRECPIDPVPIPGEPCRTESEMMAPSRLGDDFRLELRLQPPDQREEDAIREFVEWLGQIEITDEPGAFTSLADFESAVRNSLQPQPTLSSPPSSPPHFMFGSPLNGLRLHTADACDFLRAAFLIWTTELRPKFHVSGTAQSCCSDAAATPSTEECLLLGEVDVPIIAVGPRNDWRVDDRGQATIDEARRPFLIHLRLLQQLLTCGVGHHTTISGGGGGGAAPGNTVSAGTLFGLLTSPGASSRFSRSDHSHGTPPDPIPAHKADLAAHTLAGDVTGPIGTTAVERLRGVIVDPAPPSNGEVLAFSASRWRPTVVPLPPGAGNTVKPETTFGLAAAAGSDNNYSRADHSHGSPPDPIPPHRADAAAHQVLGDVTGPIGNTVVARIQNFPVQTPAAANNGNVLTFRNNAWNLEAPQGGGAAGPVVERPAGLPRYVIVAAGRVAMNGTTRGPAYNKLTATTVPTAPGIINVTFSGYVNPEPAFPHQYIVKVLPEALIPSAPSNTPTPQGVDIGFRSFDAAGFSLVATLGGAFISPSDMAKLVLQIEVSQYFTT